MNDIIKKMYDGLDPRFTFNQYIGNGFAATEMVDMEDTLVTLLKDTCKKPLKDKDWLEFISLDRMSPIEEFKDIKETSSTSTIFDITKSDFRKYEYTFIYHTKEKDHVIIKKQSLPAIDWRDSSLRVSNTKWYLAPVLTDPKLAPLPNGVGLFSKLYKNKSQILTKEHLYIINGKRRLKTFTKFENFYTLNKIERNANPDFIDLDPPLVAFLSVNKTLKEAVTKYTDYDFDKDFLIIKGKHETEDGYKYITSTREQHPDIKVPFADRHDYTIRVPNSADRVLFEIAYGMIYMFDSSPTLAERYMKSVGTKYEVDAYKLLLGHVTFKGAFDMAFTLETLTDHMRKVNSYIDTLTIRDLAKDGIHATTIEEYILEIVRLYPIMTMEGQDYNKVVRKKRFEVLYYVLYGLINKINKNIGDINDHVYFNKDYTLKHVQQVLKQTFKPKELYNISRGGSQILPLTLYDTTRDSRIYAMNSIIEVQERGSGPFKATGRKGSGGAFPSTLKSLAAVDQFRGTDRYLYAPAPSGRLRANPMGVWEDGNIVYDDELTLELDRLDGLYNQYRNDSMNNELLDTLGVIEEIEE